MIKDKTFNAKTPRDCLKRASKRIVLQSFPDTADLQSTSLSERAPFAYVLLAGMDYLIIRYPRFRVSASGMHQFAAFAFGVPHDINGFTPTP